MSCGDELTLGQKLDTNSRWLADRLLGMGIVPLEHLTVPDDEAAQAGAFIRLAERVDLIICTGGLGPTSDDLTRPALAKATRDRLITDPDAVKHIEAFFHARGRSMALINLSQAVRPTRGTCLPNAYGTAPGLHALLSSGTRECDIYCLPGPPREMMPMFESGVAPQLRPPQDTTVRTRVLHTAGIGESDLAQKLGELMSRDQSLLIGTTASMGSVSIRMRYQGPLPTPAAETLFDHAEIKIREMVGSHIFGAGEQTLPGAVIELLRDRKQTLAVVESCTGGMLGELITSVPGASDVFVGGLLTYSNQIKQTLAGVPATMFKSELHPDAPGAVSHECAKAMAAGGLASLQATHCLSITGIAGPGGAIEAAGSQLAKPVGTVYIGLASLTAPEAPLSRRFNMAGGRDDVREWACRSALAMLLFSLTGRADARLLRQAD